jgi:T-complex protein 1 subunit beta
VIGEDKVIRFTGCERGEACTIILRGASKHILDEAERSLHDALCVLVGATKNPQIIYGGGAAELVMATAVDEAAKLTAGKERYAMEAFSTALRALPTIIADNGGYDSADLIAQLSALHASGKKTMGLNMDLGIVGDMTELKITESLKSKMQGTHTFTTRPHCSLPLYSCAVCVVVSLIVLISAHEAAEMILRVDVILKCAPRKRRGPPGHEGHGH